MGVKVLQSPEKFAARLTNAIRQTRSDRLAMRKLECGNACLLQIERSSESLECRMMDPISYGSSHSPVLPSTTELNYAVR